MINVLDAAAYFLWLAGQQDDELISNLKLQKLLYYAQGYHLARHERPLFDSPIKSWNHGPVIEDVYHAYKEYGKRAIPSPQNIRTSRYREAELATMNKVYTTFGRFSAWVLRDMTHDEPLWQETKRGNVITLSQLREYFLTKVDIEPKIVQTQRKTWDEVANDVLIEHRSLWEKLARV